MSEKPKTFYTYLNAADTQLDELSFLAWEERGAASGNLQEAVNDSQIWPDTTYYLYECRPIAVLLRPLPVIVAEEPLL